VHISLGRVGGWRGALMLRWQGALMLRWVPVRPVLLLSASALRSSAGLRPHLAVLTPEVSSAAAGTLAQGWLTRRPP